MDAKTSPLSNAPAYPTRDYWTITGHCPRCGCPIYGLNRVYPDKPIAHRTCVCFTDSFVAEAAEAKWADGKRIPLGETLVR